MAKAGWWERPRARSIAETEGSVFGRRGQRYLSSPSDPEAPANEGWGVPARTSSNPHRLDFWAQLQKLHEGRGVTCRREQGTIKSYIKDRGPHTARSWVSSRRLHPSRSPCHRIMLSHSPAAAYCILCSDYLLLVAESPRLPTPRGG